jgi:hypothetical protein
MKPPTYQRLLRTPTPFEKHLDVCEQCEQHPFALCPTGAVLLRESATMKPPFDLVNEVTQRVSDTIDVIVPSDGVAMRFPRAPFVNIGDLSEEQKQRLGVANKGVLMAQEYVDRANGELILAQEMLKEARELRTQMAKEMGVNPRTLG